MLVSSPQLRNISWPTPLSEIRFKQYGLKGVEVVDNGSGIAEEDHGSIGVVA